MSLAPAARTCTLVPKSLLSQNCGWTLQLTILIVVAAYGAAIPTDRHQAAGKGSGLTNLVERLNNTMRQRVSRLARKISSFSAKLVKQIRTICYFVRGYNLSL